MQGTLVLTSSFIYDQIALWRSHRDGRNPTRIYIDEFTIQRSKYSIPDFKQFTQITGCKQYVICGLEVFIVNGEKEHFHLSE